MANKTLNFKSFIAEFPDAKHLKLTLSRDACPISDDIIEQCYSKSLGKLIVTVHKKTVIHAYFSDLAFAKNKKEVQNENN